MPDVTKLVLVVTLICSLVFCSVKARSAFAEYDDYEDGDDVGRMEKRMPSSNSYHPFSSVQRRDWCARWGDTCVPESRARFTQCCAGLNCVCGTIWHPSDRCSCRKPSLFGRR